MRRRVSSGLAAHRLYDFVRRVCCFGIKILALYFEPFYNRNRIIGLILVVPGSYECKKGKGVFMNAVIFDMDGLMFDTERVCMLAWDYAGERMGIGKAGYMVLKTLGMNTVRTKEMWNEEFGGQYDQQELEDYTNEFMIRFYDENPLPVKKGLYILLDYLKSSGYKMAVASSSKYREIQEHLRAAGVTDYFQAVVGGDRIRRSKPEPDIYLKACELLGERPEDCYALEDSKNGLLAAHRAGCIPLMVPDLWEPDEEIKRIIAGRLDDLEEVKHFLERSSDETISRK